jgi:4-amino-4-deoxy-L-arabinose transferase-like glycosyltransferase
MAQSAGLREETDLLRIPKTFLPYLNVVCFAMVLFVPFLGEPVLRTGGDEKVYIAQALEMAKRGSWFVQTLADQPDYHKGPLHYIFLRIGFCIFGTQTPWAVLWANLAAVLGASLVLTSLVRRYLRQDSLASAVGMGLLVAGGVYSYVFTSQMEIELLGMYGLSLYLVDLWQRSNRTTLVGSLLWISIGLAGWLKSPVYSVLLGIGVLLVSSLEPSLKVKQYSFGGVLAILVGILVGGLGYAIPWILDPESFYQTYILRETVAKVANEVTVIETFLPNITFNLLPFMPIAVWGMIMLGLTGLPGKVGFKSVGHSLRISTEDKYLVRMSLGMVLPTFIFFAVHPYRSMIYTLPCVPAILLLSAVGLHRGRSLAPKVTLCAFVLVPLMAALVPILALVIGWKFGAQSPWWPKSLTVTSALVLIGTFWILTNLVRKKSFDWSAYLNLCLPSFIVAGLCMVLIGRAEMQDLRGFVESQKRAGERPVLGYFNLHRHTWSEWGSLNILLGERVIGLHDEKSLKAALSEGIPVIVPSSSYLEQVYALLESKERLKVIPWSRWQSHPKDSVAHGPLAAWKNGDLSLLQSQSFIVTLR